MFSKAVSIAAGFTRAVVISSRTAQGDCAGTIGAYVVLNRAGWILTAGHLLNIVRAQQDSARRHAGYRGNVVEFHRDIAADKRFRRKGVRIFYQPAGASVRNHSVWWGADGVRLVEARVVPAADLALGRLEPFDPASVAHYPVWKDPSRDFAPGRSLCKLGFPLHRIVLVYDEKANTFTLPARHGQTGAECSGGDARVSVGAHAKDDAAAQKHHARAHRRLREQRHVVPGDREGARSAPEHGREALSRNGVVPIIEGSRHTNRRTDARGRGGQTTQTHAGPAALAQRRSFVSQDG